MIAPFTITLFGIVCGLFLAFLLWPLGPAAPLALTLPLGLYVLWRTIGETRNGAGR